MKKSVSACFSLAAGLLAPLASAQTLIGDNQSGLEAAGCVDTNRCPGIDGRDYLPVDPTHAITVLHANVIRLPFLIERAQHDGPMSNLDPTYMAHIKDATTTALNLGAVVVFDPHNFGTVFAYSTDDAASDITNPQPMARYLDFEKKFNAWIAQNFTPDQVKHLGEGLMNEPKYKTNADYQPVFQQAINIARSAGFHGLLTYPSAPWSNIKDIAADSTFMQGVTDPDNNIVAELHGYWDASTGGATGECITDPNLGYTKLHGAIEWSQRTGIKIFLGETAEPEPMPQPISFAAAGQCPTQSSESWTQSDQYFRSFMQYAIASGRLYGITFWADGSIWGPNDLFVLEQINGVDTADGLTLQSLALQNSGTINPSNWYNVVDTNSQKCVDAAAWGSSNGTPLIQYTCGANQANQEWQFTPTDSGYYTVTNRNAALVWDVPGATTAPWTQIQLWTSWSGPNQQWMPIPLGNGSYNFQARNSGLCLDIRGGTSDDGATVQQYNCNNTGAQSFTVLQKQ